MVTFHFIINAPAVDFDSKLNLRIDHKSITFVKELNSNNISLCSQFVDCKYSVLKFVQDRIQNFK